jgi:chemotaxis protein CheD
LWDSERLIGGVNHFVLPLSRDGDRTPRYGDVAIERLLQGMVRLGASAADTVAKLFGGANVLPFGENRDTVGDQNVRLALERLRDLGIRIAARRTGGESGLFVKFETWSGAAWVRPVTLTRETVHA